MYRLFCLCRICLQLVLLLAVIAVSGGMIYLNEHGFPGEWGDRVQEELAERGLHVEFSSLRYNLLDGVVGRDVLFYDNKGALLLTAAKVQLDIDKTKALRGKIQLQDFDIEGGEAYLPLLEDGKTVTVSDVSGHLAIDRNRLVVESGKGRVAGLALALEADVVLPSEKKEADEESRRSRERLVRAFLDELARWQFLAAPPELSLGISGDLGRPASLKTRLSLHAGKLVREGYFLRGIDVSGELADSLVTLDSFLIRNETGAARGRADWLLDAREGRFRVASKLRLMRMLQVCFGIDQFDEFSSAERPVFNCAGTVRVLDNGSWKVGLTGDVSVGEFRVLDKDFKSLESNFSWQNGDLYLQDLVVKHERGQLDGQIMLRGGKIRYEAKSTLPLSAYRPLIKPGSGLDKVLSRLDFQDSSVLALDAKGTINRNELTDWESEGKAYATGVSYNSVPMAYLAADYRLSASSSEFRRVSARLADGDNALAQRFGAPASEEFQADRITIEKEKKLARIDNLHGVFWPASLTRMFNPRVADYLEKKIRLHQAPALVLDGVFDLRKPAQRTTYQLGLNPRGPVDYTFLGRSLQLHRFRADLGVHYHTITLRNMAFRTLGSPFAGNVEVEIRPGKKAKFKGGMMWTRVALAEIGRKYGFKKKVAGFLTGRFDFSGTAGSARGLNGKGIVALERGDLVSLPVLGPLSPLISGVLGNKKAGYEQARDASFTFKMKRGVMRTNDFVTSSPSVILTGEGAADLAARKIDMTVRVNARGLLGLLTLPLKPINGLFQFRGTGDLLKPKWRSAPITAPARGKKDPIYGGARRAQVVPE